MSDFNLFVDQEDFSMPGDSQQWSKHSYLTHHGLFRSQPKYNYTKYRHTVVMKILRLDARQRQARLIAINKRIFQRLCFDDKFIVLRIVLSTVKLTFRILRYLVGEILHFKFDAYCAVLTGASDLKLFVGGVHVWGMYRSIDQMAEIFESI